MRRRLLKGRFQGDGVHWDVVRRRGRGGRSMRVGGTPSSGTISDYTTQTSTSTCRAREAGVEEYRG